jgi:hypothetical protein
MMSMFLLVALATFAPTPTLDSVCQGAKLGLLPEDQAGAFQTCVRDERAARDELRQKWSRFSAEMRETCAEPPGVTFSYVELLTCLEMQPGGDLTNFSAVRVAPIPLDRR